MSEFRKHGRLAATNKTVLTHERIGQISTVTRDISATGLYVVGERLANSLEPGDKLEAIVETPEKRIASVVRVVRVDHDGVGLTYD